MFFVLPSQSTQLAIYNTKPEVFTHLQQSYKKQKTIVPIFVFHNIIFTNTYSDKLEKKFVSLQFMFIKFKHQALNNKNLSI